MSILSAAPRNGESGRGRGRPPCKTARAKKRPARKRSSNRPGAQFFHVPKSGKKNLKTWSNEIMNFGFSDWQVNWNVLRLSDGTQKPSRPSAFWPTGRGISILTNQNSSMIDETDMWNIVESYLSTSQITWNHTYHHAAHAFHKHLVSCCSCPWPGRRCCYHHLDDANQIGIKNCKWTVSFGKTLSSQPNLHLVISGDLDILSLSSLLLRYYDVVDSCLHLQSRPGPLLRTSPFTFTGNTNTFGSQEALATLSTVASYSTVPNHGPALRLLCLDHLLLKSVFGYVWWDWAWYCLITCRRSKRAHVMTYDCTIFKWAKRTNKFEKV